MEFIEIRSNDEIAVRVWERGVGETLACGTGACAAAVGSALTNRTGRRVRVNLTGGQLLIEWSDNNHVFMTGPAEEVFRGELGEAFTEYLVMLSMSSAILQEMPDRVTEIERNEESMNVADRVASLPPYLFARIEQKIEECQNQGIDVINLGIGDPDLPTPPHIVQALKDQADNPANHRYPTSVGLLAFRQAVADWYRNRFGVSLDPRSEVVTLIGSKEGIGHISFCYLNPGDYALIPDPGYPVYGIGASLAGAENYLLPLKAEHGFRPDFTASPYRCGAPGEAPVAQLPEQPYRRRCRASISSRKQSASPAVIDLIICHDAPYSEITFDDYVAPSFLQAEGAREVGIEFHSLSKTYNMTGWRLGWAAGNAEVVKTLGTSQIQSRFRRLPGDPVCGDCRPVRPPGLRPEHAAGLP